MCNSTLALYLMALVKSYFHLCVVGHLLLLHSWTRKSFVFPLLADLQGTWSRMVRDSIYLLSGLFVKEWPA